MTTLKYQTASETVEVKVTQVGVKYTSRKLVANEATEVEARDVTDWFKRMADKGMHHEFSEAQKIAVEKSLPVGSLLLRVKNGEVFELVEVVEYSFRRNENGTSWWLMILREHQLFGEHVVKAHTAWNSTFASFVGDLRVNPETGRMSRMGEHFFKTGQRWYAALPQNANA